MKSRSVAGNIDWEAHQGDVLYRRKKKLTEKNEGISVGWTGEKTVKFAQVDDKKDQHSRAYASFFQEQISC